MSTIDKEQLQQLEAEILETQSEIKKPQTMKELYDTMYQLGVAWRTEHAEEKEIKKGARKGETETKIPMPTVTDVANVLLSYCHFTFIGYKTITDPYQLMIFDLDNGYYVASDEIITKLVVQFDKRLTSKRLNGEIVLYLRAYTRVRRPLDDPNLIPVQNGIFNLATKELQPFDPSCIITSKISTKYNPHATKPLLKGWFDVEDWLNELMNDDADLVTLLWQVLNEAINPNRTRGKMVVLLGEGNNGKGTFQALIENLIGKDNISNLRPEQFKESFMLASLEGKVCNIGDDISDSYLDKVSDLMSIVTGDSIQINPKFQRPYEARYSLLCIFSGNGMPRSRNRSQGWYRRLCIIPFDADFNTGNEKKEIKDQFMKDKQLLEWILYKILNMKPFDSFIVPEAVKRKIEEHKKENDFFHSFIYDYYMPNEYHNLHHVPLFIVKRWLEYYLDDEGIKQQGSLFGFGNKIADRLTKATGEEYEVKSGRVLVVDYEALDPNNLYKHEFKQSKKGIRKKGA